jgi:hypothetical protein
VLNDWFKKSVERTRPKSRDNIKSELNPLWSKCMFMNVYGILTSNISHQMTATE